MEQFIFNHIRVQFLSEQIVRIEYASKGKFCDKSTFLIPDREQFGNISVGYSFHENVLCFGDYELYLPYGTRSLLGVRLEKKGKRVYTYKKLKNSGELPPLNKTPEVFPVSDSPRIIVPEGGYSADRKSDYKITENVQDIYLLLCEKDAKKLRKLYVELTGRVEFVRLSTLGCWNSKYYAYTEEEAKRLILDYEAYDVPLDNMVIDTDWRSCEHGWGYDINTKLFPDMKRFLDFSHAHGVEIMFNDHPEPVEGAQVFDPDEIDYREKNLQALMNIGLDTWWYDRNWTSNLVSPTKNIRWETWGLYLFNDITKHFYQKQSGNKEVYRRPVIMGNVVNIVNGSYYGITDTASHRYSIQWTGDIASNPQDLGQEVVNLIRGGNNCISYINADCGGHIGNPSKEVFIRWMQFGTLSPVFRPHCTNCVERTREPWVFDEQTLNIVREYVHLRYRLLPVIYKNAYNNYVTGEPIFKGLGWEYPSDKHALTCTDAYMLGNDLLIKPIVGVSRRPVAKRYFIKPVKATYFDGAYFKGEPLACAQYSDLDIKLIHQSPEKGVPTFNFSARFETEIAFDKETDLYLRNTDGAIVWIDGEKVYEEKSIHAAMDTRLKRLEGGKTYKIKIEYLQTCGETAIGLYYDRGVKNDGKTDVYLPNGKWLDVFDGKIYTGGKTIRKAYGLREMPIFVRLGALIPLAYEARNTKEQKWNRLVYDFYPDKGSKECGYLYEDDGETTAYKYGKYRKSAYEAQFSEECNAYVIKLHAAKGAFEGERAYDMRNLTLKYHLLHVSEQVKKVTVNGEEVGRKMVAADRGAFPLNVGECAPDGKIVLVNLNVDANTEYEIRFYL